MRPGEFAMLSLGIVIAFGLGASILWNAAAAIVVVLIGSGLVLAAVSMKISRRRKTFAEQLHSTITILVGSMRAGRGLPQALELVASESSSPTAEEFRRVTVESRVGRDHVASLNAVADRMKNEDLRLDRSGHTNQPGTRWRPHRTTRQPGDRDSRPRSSEASGPVAFRGGSHVCWVVGALPIVDLRYMQSPTGIYVRLLHHERRSDHVRCWPRRS